MTGVKARALQRRHERPADRRDARAPPAASSCYQADLAGETCDFWQVTLPDSRARTTSGTGSSSPTAPTPTTTPTTPPRSTAASARRPTTRSTRAGRSCVYEPGFTAPAWAKDAVIYQIFPDRFRNGRSEQRPEDRRRPLRRSGREAAAGASYPEGYCRNYADARRNCPWRFDPTRRRQPERRAAARPRLLGRRPQGRRPAARLPQGPRRQHASTSTRSSTPGRTTATTRRTTRKIDPYFGTQKDFDNLVKHATDARHPDHPRRRVQPPVVGQPVLRPLPPLRDRGRLRVDELARTARGSRSTRSARAPAPAPGPAAARRRPTTAGSASTRSRCSTRRAPTVQAVLPHRLRQRSRKRWLQAGASGWRLDVSGDPSFPDGYWETFREVVKATEPERADHQRDVAEGLDAAADAARRPPRHDDELPAPRRGGRAPRARRLRRKGFGDSGHQIPPSRLRRRLASIREDYPDAAYYSLMNLLDSHDTERLLWTLTPGAETTRRQGSRTRPTWPRASSASELASLIQFTVPGAPTVYYGDEVGVTGDDDPDDRRTYPWADLGGIARHRAARPLHGAGRRCAATVPVLRTGDFQALLADDTRDIAAYGRKTGSQAAIVVVNRSASARVGRRSRSAATLPDGIAFTRRYRRGHRRFGIRLVDGRHGRDHGAARTARSCSPRGTVDLTGRRGAAPRPAVTGEGDGELGVCLERRGRRRRRTTSGSARSRAAATSRRTRSPVSGTSFTITGLRERAGRATSSSRRPTPPATRAPSPTRSTACRTRDRLGQPPVAADDDPHDQRREPHRQRPTARCGSTASPRSRAPRRACGRSSASGRTARTRTATPPGPGSTRAFNIDAGNNDEFKASLLPESTGTFDYA